MAAGDRRRTTSDMMGFPMGQLRTANKRRNRALAARVAAKATPVAPVTTPAPAKAVKRATS
jgi:hypothetical protein